MIAAHMAKDRSAVAVLFLAWARLGRLACRFEKLVAAVRAGRLPPAPELRGKAARDLEFPRLDGLPPPRLPGGFGWLIRLVPGAAVYGSQVQYLLADPEMAALLASTPQAGRILRPLCQMLAIPLGPEPGGTRWRRAASPSRSIPPASPPRVRLCFSPWGRRGWGLPTRKHRVPFCAAKWGPELGSRPWPAQPADPADSGGQPHASANRLVPPCSPAGSRPRAGLEPLQAPPGRPRPDEVGAGFGAPSRSRDGNPDATGADPPLPPPALA
ncbi:MAG: hypothetical protein JO212_14405 [Acetobacteraceae bacterium]|nr:hypothetical protein [Acetobacteraceae bacterium]